ncbi:hypothetical protein [Pseudomonas tohonis]|uniref:hypothetical protein n=1 Tax=Pseudomonas tohonis TaxID=2725477 RepID=UPI001F3AD2DE|nr:hypothetical protein [Pseudomonas tohonis]
MSDVKRYAFQCHRRPYGMEQVKLGNFVHYEDHAVLTAERDQLRAELAAIRGQEAAAEVSAETFSSNGTSDIITANLPIGTKLYSLPPEQPVPRVNEFAMEILRGALEGGGFDGGDIQEMGVKYGLLFPEQRTEPCCESGCNCAEFGFPTECFRIAPGLLSTPGIESGGQP